MRLVAAAAIFVATVAGLIVVAALILDLASQHRVIGFAFVGGQGRVVVMVLLCLLLGSFSYWLAGRFLRSK